LANREKQVAKPAFIYTYLDLTWKKKKPRPKE
jgi:hypothetical protein